MRTKTAFILGAILVGWVCGFGTSNGQDPGLPKNYSGVYPHLATFNEESECGTGAVVPWADRLWVVSYGPHLPQGSSDKLYEIDARLNEVVRPESVGGTPANRMIHRESGQLFIGPYAIDSNGIVRVIPYRKAPGRPTGNARHLTDPENKIYCATMEEGLYEIDVRSLDVVELYPDANGKREKDILPGYHGKGFYSGQNRCVYSNNGEQSQEALTNPNIPSGALGQWNGSDWNGDWDVVLRNQFCEVTGPGGIFGNENPETDPIWTVGWDYRSLILAVLDGGKWFKYRLPKASHCYDGAHGWNTEWPRIREIDRVGEEPSDSMLMTMHGMFWRFPKTFDSKNAVGIRPRSTYLKVIGDFARWNDFENGKYIVFGCDDSAKSEFLNKRKFKGNACAAGQSQSNLWFVEDATLDRLGPAIGRGAVWFEESITAGVPSEPFLFAGFSKRGLHIAQNSGKEVDFILEIDRRGDGTWETFREISVPADGYRWIDFDDSEPGEWIRLISNSDISEGTALFDFRNDDERTSEADSIFDGIATLDSTNFSGGIVRTRGGNYRNLNFAATVYRNGEADPVQYYELDAETNLTRKDDSAALDYILKNAAIPTGLIQVEPNGVLIIDDSGRRFRLPQGSGWANLAESDGENGLVPMRSDREVCTERDLFNVAGTFYELPAENAGGFMRIRPIATHNRKIVDYCSYRGLLILSGIDAEEAARTKNPHIIRSDDGRVALWAGVVDDLWKLGKPEGVGGPWFEEKVAANVPSDPFLASGFDRKRLTLNRRSEIDPELEITVEVDVCGNGRFYPFQRLKFGEKDEIVFDFPDRFAAYWIRLTSNRDAKLNATFEYK